MKDRVFLVFNKSTVVKKTKNPPSLSPSEFFLVVDVIVPNSYFIEPTLKATITLPPNKVEDDIIAKVKSDLTTVTRFVNPHIELEFKPEEQPTIKEIKEVE